ncbi:MAG: FGGY family carbohydrate kinase, partial [Paracoccaceae bacterium]
MPKSTGWRLMPGGELFLGVDVGTSGVRAVVIDALGAEVAHGAAAMPGNRRDPAGWWRAVGVALRAALAGVDAAAVRAISVDGTSGTMVAVDASGEPLAEGSMYNDPCEAAAVLAVIAAKAPVESAARGATSGLARALGFQALRPHKVLHQADWIAFRLSGRMVSDANNALKTGYDPVSERWGEWIAETGMDMGLLPDVVAPGTDVGAISRVAAAEFGLPASVRIVAGTTDGCASFLATGASRVGDGVTVLGTTLTLKI